MYCITCQSEKKGLVVCLYYWLAQNYNENPSGGGGGGGGGGIEVDSCHFNANICICTGSLTVHSCLQLCLYTHMRYNCEQSEPVCSCRAHVVHKNKLTIESLLPC